MATIYKTGNSLVVTLKRDILKPLGLKEGSEVDVQLSLDGKIEIKPIEKSDNK